MTLSKHLQLALALTYLCGCERTAGESAEWTGILCLRAQGLEAGGEAKPQRVAPTASRSRGGTAGYRSLPPIAKCGAPLKGFRSPHTGEEGGSE